MIVIIVITSHSQVSGGLSSSDDPTIYLARGQTYQFDINASGHPFHIQTSSGAYNSSNLYTTGVSTNWK